MHISENQKQKEEFGRFFIANYPRVKTFARQIVMSEQDAEDIAQDVFLKLMDKPEIWQDEERRDSYLYKTTKNHIFNFIKHKNIERKYQENLTLHDELNEIYHPEDDLYAKEMRLIIIHAIECLPDRRKEVFKMSRFGKKSNRQIAEILDMSVRTVERHIYLALAELKKTLNHHLSVE
jgi:RNA polymerase sigma-70 factor (ECF subfamily)